MTTTNLRPICRAVHTALFQSKEYRALPEDGHARLLLLCLLIHPHGGSFHLPGLYNVGRESLREVACMPRRAFGKALGDLIEAKLVDFDESNRLIWIPTALRLVGPPGNPNVVKGYARTLAQLPTSRLVLEATSAYLVFLKAFGLSFWEPFAKAFGTLDETCEKDSQSLDQKILYINRNKNKDINTNSNNAVEGSKAVGLSHIMAFVEDAGRDGVTKRQAQLFLGQVPELDRDRFLGMARQMYMREDIRDPLAYMLSVLQHGSQRDQASTEQAQQAESPELDGAEVNFNG